MKKKFVIAIGCVLLLAVAIVLLFVWKKNRGGVLITCNKSYNVNAHLLSYRQDDDRWGADHLGESRYTMESSGCIVTSIATAISASDKAMNPGSLNAYLSNNQVFDGEGNLQWGKLDELEGFHVSVYSDVADQHLEECLDEGHYPIVKIHRNTLTSYHHYIVIIGSKDGDYICMDPLQDELTHLSDYGNKVYAIRCVWVDESACTEKQININQAEAVQSNEKKLYIPEDAECKSYTWNEVCDYFGKDISLSALPETFDENISAEDYKLYVSATGEVVYDNIELYYEGNNGQYIRCVVSKGKEPVMDEVYSGGECSIIGEKQVYIYQAQDVYVTTFLQDEIGYHIVAKGVSENEFVDILKEILK